MAMGIKPIFKGYDGFADYLEISEYMENHVNSMIKNTGYEEILFLQHPPLYTAGTSAKPNDILAPEFPIFESPRGGQMTYHGPGQLVIYIMLDLNKRKKDIRLYIQAIEEWGIKTLQHFGIQTFVREDRVGLWVDHKGLESKIAAIGVRVRRWITYHGMSININPNLDHFKGIVPCGLKDFGVTSMHDMGVTATLDDVTNVLKATYDQVEFFNDLTNS